MVETFNPDVLEQLPAWKSLAAAKQQKLVRLEQAIQAKASSLKALAKEVPLGAMGGMVFGAANESLDLEQQFTRSKEEIQVLQDELAKTIRIDTRVVREAGKASYGSLVLVRNLNVPCLWSQRVFRLVLMSEPEQEHPGSIEHVELGSPLGNALHGLGQGQEFRIGLGPNHVRAEVEAVF